MPTTYTYSAITKPTVGNGVSKADEGDKMADDLAYFYALLAQPIYIPINGATPLVAGDKQYWPVPRKYHLGTLTGVAAKCKDASTSGGVELAIKIGANSMLSTNITLDQNETDTNTAAVPAVIDTSHDDLHNDGAAAADLVEISVVSAGTGVTYCGVELTVRPAASVSL